MLSDTLESNVLVKLLKLLTGGASETGGVSETGGASETGEASEAGGASLNCSISINSNLKFHAIPFDHWKIMILLESF